MRYYHDGLASLPYVLSIDEAHGYKSSELFPPVGKEVGEDDR